MTSDKKASDIDNPRVMLLRVCQLCQRHVTGCHRIRVSSCRVPEMENFYQPAIFVQPVVDAYWRMENFANARSATAPNANPGQVLEQLDMVKEGCTELLGGARVVGANVVENDF